MLCPLQKAFLYEKITSAVKSGVILEFFHLSKPTQGHKKSRLEIFHSSPIGLLGFLTRLSKK